MTPQFFSRYGQLNLNMSKNVGFSLEIEQIRTTHKNG